MDNFPRFKGWAQAPDDWLQESLQTVHYAFGLINWENAFYICSEKLFCEAEFQ